MNKNKLTRYRNLNYIFEVWEIPEDINNYINGNEFFASDDMPRWLEDIDDLYVMSDELCYKGVSLKPGTILVWNTPLGTIQDIFTDKEEFESQYYSNIHN